MSQHPRQRNFKLILTTVLAAMALIYVLLGLLLADGSIVIWSLLAIPFVILGLTPISWRLRRNEKDWWEKAFARLSYLCMGVMSFLILYGVVYAVINIAAPGRLNPNFVYTMSALSLAVGWYWAATGPRAITVPLKVADLPDALNGMRIVQISDLHISDTIDLKYVTRTVEIANRLKPDVIALTGDIGDGRPESFAPEIEMMGKLSAPLGVFYAPGNHEYYWNVNNWVKSFARGGATAVVNSGKMVVRNGAKVFVGGISDPAAVQMVGGETAEELDLEQVTETDGDDVNVPRVPGAPDISASLRGSDGAAYKILLSHRPGFFREAAAKGYDLQLSGHTHGGQFVPWTWIVAMIHRPSRGAHLFGKLWLYVSVGTGSWGPLLRLGTTSEVTCLILQKA